MIERAVRQPQDVEAILLDSPAAMMEALEFALTVGYRGQAGGYVKDGEQVWLLELNGPGSGKSIPATLGQVVVWNSAVEVMEILSSDTYQKLYRAG